MGHNWGTMRKHITFAVVAALAAGLIDAVVAHGLFWLNDPHWTYRFTQLFLIATVLALGAPRLGVGLMPGLILSALATLALALYSQFLSPVGLPYTVEWAPWDEVWTVGLPVHYLAVLAGYLAALWLWKRPPVEAHANPLLAALLVVGLDLLVTQLLLLRDWPGPTLIVQRLLIAFVFLSAWFAYVGLDRAGWVVGAGLLSLIWTGWSLYLAPQGLPGEPRFLGWYEVWSRVFPGGFVAALIGMLAAAHLRPAHVSVAMLLALVSPAQAQPWVQGEIPRREGLEASASASGTGRMAVGKDPFDFEKAESIRGDIEVMVVDAGDPRSAVQNRDRAFVMAAFKHAGARYRVVLSRLDPAEGVTLRKQGAIALTGYADVRKDGAILGKARPTQVLVTEEAITLSVDPQDRDVPGTPASYLTVQWPKLKSLQVPDEAMQMRQLAGFLLLVGITAAFWWLSRRP